MNSPQEPPKPPQQQMPLPAASNLNTDLIKAVLEFVSRCFYPAIIVFVLLLIAPALAQIDFKALFDRLQKAKAGDYELTFGQAQDVGAERAGLNNKIADLERTLAAIRSDFDVFQKKVGATPAIEATQKQRALEEKQFQENSRYTVLVFHGPNGRPISSKITDALLKVGYKASRTETDFAELRKTHPPGTVYVTHSNAGESVLPRVSKLLQSLALGTELKIQQTSTELRRGEVQVLVF
jgi:hypothetical protein